VTLEIFSESIQCCCALSIVLALQLKSMLQRGGTIDWSSDCGYAAFNTMFKPDLGHTNDHFSLRDAQLSSELSQVAVKLAHGRDIFYVGSLVNRAIREGFHKMATAMLDDHPLKVDEEGNTLLMCATLNSWDSLVKHLVYMEGVDVEARNKVGRTAIELAVERVPPCAPLLFQPLRACHSLVLFACLQLPSCMQECCFCACSVSDAIECPDMLKGAHGASTILAMPYGPF
jgi:hypothetical protein